MDLVAAAEVSGLARRRLANEYEPHAGRLELITGAIQLDRVRLAEDSPVVAEPYEDCWLPTPEIAEANVVPVVVGEDDPGELVGARRGVGPLPS